MNQGSKAVAEIYSPPRISKMAEKVGLTAGWALDLTTNDPDDDQPWDFTSIEKRNKARMLLRQDKPYMLIASPMCGPFSALQTLFNYQKMDKKDVELKLRKATEHVMFTIEMCIEQREAGRAFMFEHPAGASSWHLQCLKALGRLEGVYEIDFDFCMLGMTTTTKDGDTASAKKRTKVLTHSKNVALLLEQAQCRKEHGHQELLDGRASKCQEYPDKFAKLICEGVKRDLETVEWRDQVAKSFDITQPFGKLMAVQAKMEATTVPEEDPWASLYNDMEFMDDVSGAPLNKADAIQARKDEMAFFKSWGVYTKVKREAWMKVVTTKWIDINKGDEIKKNYRARLVGREIAKDKRLDLFAATHRSRA